MIIKLQVSSREEEVAATFNIEMVTRTTEFRVRPGDKVALPCEVRSSGDHMLVHVTSDDNISEDATQWGARILQSILDLFNVK